MADFNPDDKWKENIQGDIWPRLPKKVEAFYFFEIKDVANFRDHLKEVVPDITTASKAQKDIRRIKRYQADNRAPGRTPKLLRIPGVNIAFTSKGLNKLGKTDFMGGLFQKGMHDDLVSEGWDDPRELLPAFKPPEGSTHGQTRIDGVILIAADSQPVLRETINSIVGKFSPVVEGPSIEKVCIIEGKIRPGEHKGKEHFGFQDGISQPAIEKLDPKPKRDEPQAVLPGHIFCGYDGDPLDNRPDWTMDGSFLVFRHFRQYVPEFNQFMKDKAEEYPNHEDEHEKADRAEKLAAHLMGRWKSGVPVDIHPHRDYEHLTEKERKDRNGTDIRISNAFTYNPPEKHNRCPFAAHTRKMRPRKDLDDDHAVIIRRGIEYGDEVTAEEIEQNKTIEDRGLLFVCYQSDIRNGFNFLTTRWASNHHFPDRKQAAVGSDGPGIDAIVGQRLSHHPPRSIGLPDGKETSTTRISLDTWTKQQGGEYFFSPSISALNGIAAQA